MFCFQKLFRICNVCKILSPLIPWHFQHGFNICTDHTRFCRTLHGIFKSADLFFQLFFYLIRCIQRFCLLCKFLRIGNCSILTKLFSDQLQLFAQDIFSLMLIHTLFHLHLDLIADVHDLHLIDQLKGNKLITSVKIKFFQDFLQFPVIQRHIRCHLIHHLFQFRDLFDLVYHIFCDLRHSRRIIQIQIPKSPHHRFPVDLACNIRITLFRDRNICPKIRICKFYCI